MKKLTNLECYYRELQRDSKLVMKPFNTLSNIEKWRLETSTGFKRFLIIGIWTKVILWGILIIILTAVGSAIYQTI